MGKKKDTKKPSLPDHGGVKAKVRSRYLSLLRDYGDLLKETEAKRKQLTAANRKKMKLISEVKFLHRRSEQLRLNEFGRTVYPLKITHEVSQPREPAADELRRSEKSVRHTTAFIDLNQPCLPTGDESEKSSIHQESVQNRKRKKQLPEGGSDSVCRVVRSAVNQAGKRKITWQDRVGVKSIEIKT